MRVSWKARRGPRKGDNRPPPLVQIPLCRLGRVPYVPHAALPANEMEKNNGILKA